MGLHTARLVFTVIFFMLALAGALSGFWFTALFWALMALAVGHPFARGGRVDLYYEDAPAEILVYRVADGPAAGAADTPLAGASPALQQLVAGTF